MASAQAPEADSVYIENKGSDTIVNLALAWAETYQAEHADVRISVTGGGSGTGIAALVNGTVDIANASRRIKEEEIAEAKAKGIEPVEHVIARDAIAVIVHPDNPVSELTLQQISDIYSGQVTNWKQVGGEDRPIVRLSRETNSGTHVYFLETVLRLGGERKQNPVFDGYPAPAFLRRDYQRGAPKPECDWLRWSGICSPRPEKNRHCQSGWRALCFADGQHGER